MATKTSIQNKPRATKVVARISLNKQRSTKKASAKAGVMSARKIPGLKGSGLIQDGRMQKLELRARLQMPRPTFGKIVNVAERTIADIEAGKDSVNKLKRPYNEVYKLCEALSEVVDPDCLGKWFETPNKSFGGLTPIELIEQGDIDQLWNMVFELQTGMPG